jgi:prepilin-type N-terminal cleavage/methylation domain-containing protein
MGRTGKSGRAGPRSGFTLLEMVLVVAIVSVLVIIALDKLSGVRVDAERVAMETVIGSLESALNVTLASHAVKGRLEALAALAGSNPMDLLAKTPRNYLGALSAPDPHAIQGYAWYFDRGAGALVYRVQNVEYFATDLPGPARARWRVALVFDDFDGDGAYQPGLDAVEGLRLETLEPYRWTEKPRRYETTY